MRTQLVIHAFVAALLCLEWCAAADGIDNLTGLPLYPDVNDARMDQVARTDKLGHWCNRFSARTFAPLSEVEAWYRRNLINPSETDLRNDERYRSYADLVGIKLGLGVDYVAVFRTSDSNLTTIELLKCSAA
jgi:hypothetical protein